MARLIFITHPEVIVDPECPVEDWPLSPHGIDRAKSFALSAVLKNVTQIWASPERKAQETATILSETLGVEVQIHPRLNENDRTATGFLPPDQFEAAADAFFASPDHSFKGWETARDAQIRIVDAVMQISSSFGAGDIAIVAHGAVGTLLHCHLSQAPIDRAHDQPHQGHFWVADRPDLKPHHGWRSIG